MYSHSAFRRALTAVILVCGILPAVCGAQGGFQLKAPPDPGDLGVFFDAAATIAVRNGVVAYAPFDFYVFSFDVPGGMAEYELSITLPWSLLISGGRQLPAGAVDASAAGDDNWIVSTGAACLGATGALAVVSYTGALFLAQPGNDLTLCLGAATPSRFGLYAPGYLACGPTGGLHAFGAAYDGCAVINRSSPPCFPSIDHLTISVANGETAAGTPVSLLVRCDPTIIPCPTKDSWSPIPVSHVELDLSWDPAVASLTGARCAALLLDPPQVQVTLGTGSATVVMDHWYGIFNPYHSVNLAWLDFVTLFEPGQTPVNVDRLVVSGDGYTLPTQPVGGSITTGAVPSGALSVGELKARWDARD